MPRTLPLSDKGAPPVPAPNRKRDILTVTLIAEWLRRIFGGLHVQEQGPIDVAESDRETNEPEPDIAVLAEPITAFTERHPRPSEVRLVVEVSDTSLRFDLRNKATLYARVGIEEYRVVDIVDRRILVHRRPESDGYAEVIEYAETEPIAPRSRPESSILVANLLPPTRAA